MKADKITVLRIDPGEEPIVKEITNNLESLQHEVGGYIEAIYPYDDMVAIIDNEEGKLIGLPLNRALRDHKGEIYDVIAGPFLIVGLTKDSFASLPEEFIDKYRKKFMPPEVIFILNGKITAVPIQ